MAATDLERFSVRALLRSGARGRCGRGAACSWPGGARRTVTAAPGPRRRADSGTPERALGRACQGSRVVGRGRLARRLASKSLSRAEAKTVGRYGERPWSWSLRGGSGTFLIPTSQGVSAPLGRLLAAQVLLDGHKQ